MTNKQETEKPESLVSSLEFAYSVHVLDRDRGIVYLMTGEAEGVTLQVIGRGRVFPADVVESGLLGP